MQTFTKEELAKFDGKDGVSAYIAYEGLVYDVSNSFLWQRGKHQVVHHAGVDYTGKLQQAPHSAELLLRVPVIGKLEESDR